eukprot:961645-Pleurochrysis_carterae.AAC.1
MRLDEIDVEEEREPARAVEQLHHLRRHLELAEDQRVPARMCRVCAHGYARVRVMGCVLIRSVHTNGLCAASEAHLTKYRTGILSCRARRIGTVWTIWLDNLGRAL